MVHRLLSGLYAGATCAAVGMGVTACAVNPATGGRQLMLVSEGQEIRMGQEADPEVVASFGLYDDPALQQYVQGLGLQLARASERPNLPWTFRVVDDPIVNAFALPGGFVYVSRGILAHFESEAQLVSVLGHEIGHVTARHSASQMSQQQLAQIGLVAGVVLAPDLADFAGIAQAGLGLLFLKFSRDDERQADQLGFRYMTRVNYDPRQMPGVFAMLGRVTEAGGGSGVPSWLSTHPEPGDRQQRIQGYIAQSGSNFAGATVRRDEYLRRLDGMVYGDNPREGFFRGTTFLHPDLRLQLTFPTGWRTANRRQAVLGMSPNEDALLQLSVAQGSSAVTAARDFLTQEGLTGSAVRSTVINGMRAAGGDFAATTNQTEVRGTVLFVEYEGNLYRLLGYGTSAGWPGYVSAVQQSFRSFDRLTDRSALDVQPMRLQIVALERPMTIEEFSGRYPSGISVETVAIINQMELGQRMPAGQLVKRVVGTPPR